MRHKSLVGEFEPPRWPRTVLRLVLSSCALGDAILGDLREEFVADVARLGLRAARMSYRRRVLGIAAYAIRDLLCWRAWSDAQDASLTHGVPPPMGPSRPHLSLGRRLRAVGGRADYRLVAVTVLGLGIGSNVSLFTLVQGVVPRPLFVMLAAAGFALLVASAHVASVTLCSGLRRGRERPDD